MPTYMGKTVTDKYMKELLDAYRTAYEAEGNGDAESSDQPIITAMEEAQVVTAPHATTLGSLDAVRHGPDDDDDDDDDDEDEDDVEDDEDAESDD